MKAFRGTLLALLLFGVALLAWLALRPPPPAPRPSPRAGEEGVPLFQFEKADLVKITVKRPDRTIVLAERGDGWWIEGEEVRASRSMVNRVKHQFHDLVSRATVVDDADGAALYGLGVSAITVRLDFRDGGAREFMAGDPNPSGVSFYVRPLPGETIYTVKKSAVDYYVLSLDEFRERRFASFDSKDVDALEAALPGGRRLAFQRTGDHEWELTAPERFAAADGAVRGLLGRVAALKAAEFVTDEPGDLAAYGLDAPRAEIGIRFSSRAPLTLLVGADTGRTEGEYPLAWMKLADEPSVYVARAGLLDDYLAPVGSFRLTRFVRLDANRVSRLTSTLATTGRDGELNGSVTVRMAADRWLWEDGVPVPGSTPKRLAQRAAGLDAAEFVAEGGEDRRWGFDRPEVTLELADLDGQTRTLLLGGEAPSLTDPEGRVRERRYARIREYPEVYIVDSGVYEVVLDLHREHRRKAEGDAAAGERHERLREEGVLPPTPPPGGTP